LRQVASAGFLLSEFAVANHAAAEHRRQVNAHLNQDRDFRSRQQSFQNAEERHTQQRQVPLSRVPPVGVETQDERHQIERQRKDPQERDRRHVHADLIRRGQKHHRRHHCQAEPGGSICPARRLRVFVSGCGFCRGSILNECVQVLHPKHPAGTGRTENGERSEAPRPEAGLRGRSQHRFEHKRKRNQSQQRADVRQRVQPVRRHPRSLQTEPSLQQRTGR
jgi:hypothetical protein